MKLSKYAKRLLRDVINEIETYPKSFHYNKIQLVRKNKSVPYGVIGDLPTKVLEAAGIDVVPLLKSTFKKDWGLVTESVADFLLFGNTISDAYPFQPEDLKKDPVGRIERFIKTDGKE
jgi:hypothetical protein